MTTSSLQVLICLLAGIAVIIILTAKFRVHAFFALLITSFVVGLYNRNGETTLCFLDGGRFNDDISCESCIFLVIAKFSSLEMKPMLKVYSVATILMGLVQLLTVYILSLILLK